MAFVVGYSAIREKKRYIVVDGVEYPTGDRAPAIVPGWHFDIPFIRNGYPVFSPDSRHVAYVRSTQWDVWRRDPKQLEAVDGVGSGWKGGIVGFGWKGPDTLWALVS